MSARSKIAALLVAWPLLVGSATAQSRVQVVTNESARRVDVTVDGKPFTSYIWPTSLKKPVLYPLRTAKGTVVTRGFPLEPRPGERVDHPHHAGLWFNHGDVNGLDFWNNSDAIPAAQAGKMGTIVHQKVVEAKSGAGQGELTVETAWQKPDGSTLLRERTRFVFRAEGTTRSIDRITTLTALGERVVFKDNKEALIGMRVARGLEQPATQPEVFTDASGRASAVPVLDNTGVTGQYTSSEGLKGDAVWGTRGRWTMLTGTVESEPVTLVMLDHPSNPGFPTYWHARGYGLFAANPMGEKIFTEGKKELNVAIEPGASIVFRHRILILTGQATPDVVERQYRAFTGS
jgi:Methane oxygenase PmoA